MNSESNLDSNDALVLVYLRNEFYRKRYHAAVGLWFLTLFCIGVLVSILVYMVKNPTHPLYFTTDAVGRLLPDEPVQIAGFTTQQVADWVVHGVEAAYSYDFVNYRAQLQDAQKYFTPYGWSGYMRALASSDNLLALARYKYVVIAKVVSPPVLVTQGTLGGAFAWKFQMPVLVTYQQPPYDGKIGFQNPLLVTVTVQRQDLLRSFGGLGILQMIATLQSNPSQNLAVPPT